MDNNCDISLLDLGSNYKLCDMSKNDSCSIKVKRDSCIPNVIQVDHTNVNIDSVSPSLLPPLNPLTVQTTLLSQSSNVQPIYKLAFDSFKGPFKLNNFRSWLQGYPKDDFAEIMDILCLLLGSRQQFFLPLNVFYQTINLQL